MLVVVVVVVSKKAFRRVVVDGVREMPLSRLRPWSRNPRWIRPERLKELMTAMTAERQMLLAKPIWALPDGTVFAGNQRLAAALALGWKMIPVIIVHGLTETQVRTWALLDNNSFGDWDQPALAEFLADLLAEGVDAALTGFETRDLDALLMPLKPSHDPEELPEVPETPESQPGEMYGLGAHRLLCGDATDVSLLRRLLAGQRVAALVTDFPWGVDYHGKTREQLTIANDEPVGLPEFLTAAFAALSDVLGENVSFYLFAPSGPAGTEFLLALREVGWQHRQTLVWCKDAIVVGHGDYHQRHESILYGFTPGPGRVGRGTGNGWHGGNDQGSVLFCGRPKQSREHPTSKPVELLARLIRNSTRRGELVVDPFAGSGATLLAAELTGRRCLAVELEPRYADVIRRRYARFVGDW